MPQKREPVSGSQSSPNDKGFWLILPGISHTDFDATDANDLESSYLRNILFPLEKQQSHFQGCNSTWNDFHLNKRRLLILCSLCEGSWILGLAFLAELPRAWVCQSFRHNLHFFTLMWIMRSFSKGWSCASGKVLEIRRPELALWKSMGVQPVLYLWGNCWQARNNCWVAVAVTWYVVNAKLLALCFKSNK